MTPVDQTTFGHPGGNCFSACVASLLDLSISDVPYFMGSDDDPKGAWAERLDNWLRPRGLYALHFEGDPTIEDYPTMPGYYILNVKSPRGDHAVVARGKQMVHDPHPARDAIVTKVDGFVLLIPLFDGGAK
jgi:hypothetical protein